MESNGGRGGRGGPRGGPRGGHTSGVGNKLGESFQSNDSGFGEQSQRTSESSTEDQTKDQTKDNTYKLSGDLNDTWDEERDETGVFIFPKTFFGQPFPSAQTQQIPEDTSTGGQAPQIQEDTSSGGQAPQTGSRSDVIREKDGDRTMLSTPTPVDQPFPSTDAESEIQGRPQPMPPSGTQHKPHRRPESMPSISTQTEPQGRHQPMPSSGAQTEPQGRHQPFPSTDEESEPQGRPQPMPSSGTQTEPQGRHQPMPSSGAQTEPQGRHQPMPSSGTQTEPQGRHQPMSPSGAQHEPQGRPQPMPSMGTQTEPQDSSQSMPPSGAQHKPQSRPQPMPSMGTQTETQGRPQLIPPSGAQPKIQSRSQPTSAPKGRTPTFYSALDLTSDDESESEEQSVESILDMSGIGSAFLNYPIPSMPPQMTPSDQQRQGGVQPISRGQPFPSGARQQTPRREQFASGQPFPSGARQQTPSREPFASGQPFPSGARQQTPRREPFSSGQPFPSGARQQTPRREPFASGQPFPSGSRQQTPSREPFASGQQFHPRDVRQPHKPRGMPSDSRPKTGIGSAFLDYPIPSMSPQMTPSDQQRGRGGQPISREPEESYIPNELKDRWTEERTEGGTWIFPNTMFGQPFPSGSQQQTPSREPSASGQQFPSRDIRQPYKPRGMPSDSRPTDSLIPDELKDRWTEERTEGGTWIFPNTMFGQPFPSDSKQQTPRREPSASGQQFPSRDIRQPYKPRGMPSESRPTTDSLIPDELKDRWTEERTEGGTWIFPKTMFGQPFPSGSQQPTQSVPSTSRGMPPTTGQQRPGTSGAPKESKFGQPIPSRSRREPQTGFEPTSQTPTGDDNFFPTDTRSGHPFQPSGERTKTPKGDSRGRPSQPTSPSERYDREDENKWLLLLAIYLTYNSLKDLSSESFNDDSGFRE